MKACEHTYAAAEQETPSPPGTPNAEADRKLSSRYRGVCWNKKNKRWQAAINRAGRYIYLGSFLTQEDAAKAFDKAAVKLRGPSAKINFGFNDYEPEMLWYNQMSARGDFTKLVLDQPKLLREETTALPPATVMAPSPLFDNSAPYFQNPACAMYNHHGRIPEMTPQPMYMSPLQGRMVGHHPHVHPTSLHLLTDGSLQQGGAIVGGASVTTGKDTAMYFQGTAPYPQQVMQSYPFVTAGNELLSHPGFGPFRNFCTNQFPLSDPSVKPEPVAVSTPVSEEPLLPVVNMPDGATLKHVYRTNSNAFAVGFVRKEAKETEVLLYDGRAMHEVGSFSTSDDAEQTCKALLRIVGSCKHGPGDLMQTSQVTVEPFSMPVIPKPFAIQDNIDVPYLDKPRGVSPFCVPVGQRPFETATNKRDSADSDRTGHAPSFSSSLNPFPLNDCVDEANNFDSNGGEGQSAATPAQSSLLEVAAKDVRNPEPMLYSDPTLSLGGFVDPTGSNPPLAESDLKCDNSVKLFSSLSLISGSLKNIVAVFNQSGSFSILRREDVEDEAPGTPTQPAAAGTDMIPSEDEPGRVTTPRQPSPGPQPNAFAPASSPVHDNQQIAFSPSAMICQPVGKRGYVDDMDNHLFFKKQRSD